jgi:hypothetical protein
MSNLKEKSIFNYDAAELLIQNNLYAPSIHCSYYSCFQLLKYIIYYFFGVEYTKLASDISHSGKKTHEYIIEYVYDEIDKNSRDIGAKRNFKRKINELKRFRIDSDYDDVEIDLDKSDKAYRYSAEIRSYLQQTFHV